MFGHVPRLPVDIAFKTVMLDPVVADFSSYSKTLLSFLTEAARIVQNVRLISTIRGLKVSLCRSEIGYCLSTKESRARRN